MSNRQTHRPMRLSPNRTVQDSGLDASTIFPEIGVSVREVMLGLFLKNHRVLVCFLCFLSFLCLSAPAAKADNLTTLAQYFEVHVANLTKEKTVTDLIATGSDLAATVDFAGLVNAAVLTELRSLNSRTGTFYGNHSVQNLIDAISSGYTDNEGKKYNLGDVINAIKDNHPKAVADAVEATQGKGDDGKNITMAHIVASQAAGRAADLNAADFVNADHKEAIYNADDHKVDTSGMSHQAHSGEVSKGASSMTALKDSAHTKKVTNTLTSTLTPPKLTNTARTHKGWSCITIPMSKLKLPIDVGLKDQPICIGTAKYNDKIILFLELLITIAAFFLATRIVFA